MTDSPTLPFDMSAILLNQINVQNATSLTELLDKFNQSNKLIKVFALYFLVIEIIILLPAIFGNSLIIISVARFKHLRTHMHILVGNLAVSDLLVGLVLIPLDIFLMNVDNHVYLLMKNVCLTRISLTISFLLASILNLFLISVERYAAIVHPLKYNRKCTCSLFTGGIVLSWSVSLTLGFLPLMGWNIWTSGMPCDSEILLTFTFKFIASVLLVGAIVANFVMFLRVVQIAWKQIERIRLESEKCTGKVKNKLGPKKKDLRKTKVMILILGIFALCWGPFCICIIVDIFMTGINPDMVIVKKFLFHLGMLNSCLNWLIYGLKNTEFRAAFKLILKCKMKNDNLVFTSSGNRSTSEDSKELPSRSKAKIKIFIKSKH